MKTMLNDLRHGLRGIAAHRGSFVFAGAILAAGLALAIAMASVVDTVLLRQLPFPNGERLLQVKELTADGRSINLAKPNHDDLAEAVDAFAATTYYAGGDSIVATPARAITAMTTYAGGDFFGVLGVAPARGRTWQPGQGEGEVVISHALWQGLLQGREDVLGSRLDVDGEAHTVIGVMPAGFAFPFDSGLWVAAPAYGGNSRSAHNWHMLALLHAANALEPARQQAQALAARLLAEHGSDMDARGFDLMPLADATAAPVRTALLVLSAGVGFLLLIAVSNALNLLLSLSLARGREFALRAALGASRWRLARQQLVEHGVLMLAAWALGIVLGKLALVALLALAADSLPRGSEITLTGDVVVASALLSLVLAVLLTLAGQVGARDRAPAATLREGGRGQSASRAALRTQSGLLVAQTALTTALLVAAVLVGRSFLALMAVDAGFNEHGAVRVEINMPAPGTAEAAQAMAARYQSLIDELAALPGIAAVGGVNRLPLTGGANGSFWDHTLTAMQQPIPAPLGSAEYRVASAGYFAAAGIPLLQGRGFAASDRADGEHVGLISRIAARETFGDADPIGRRIQWGNMDGDLRLITLVGVVGDVQQRRLDQDANGTIYVNVAQRPRSASQFNLVVRSELPLASVMPLLRERLEQTAAQMPFSLQPLSEVRASTLVLRRFNLVLLGSFAVAALLLAATGLYGLMAYSVGRRGNEFALRQALGATASGIGALVLRGGLRIAVTGIAIGVVVALAGSTWLASLLYGIPTADPASYALVVGALLPVAALSCLVPALRAARVAPATTLH